MITQPIKRSFSKQVVVAWALIENDPELWDNAGRPTVFTQPIVHNIGSTGAYGDGYIEGDSELENRHPLAYLPATPGTFRITVDLKTGSRSKVSVVGVQHPYDGTDDAYWEEQAQEQIAQHEEMVDQMNRSIG